MDSDLMARRLRPPSEPVQSQQTQPTYPPAPERQPADEQFDQALPQWLAAPPAPEQPLADRQMPAEPIDATVPPWAPETAESLESSMPAQAGDATALPWAPEEREEVPWDRPDDYDKSTDTASRDEQTAWDKPADKDWVDPNPAWPAVSVVGDGGAVASEPAFVYPDDAYAPVLGDVASPMARAWPETNGHHAHRDASTVSQPEMVQNINAQSPSAAEPIASVGVYPNPGGPNPPKRLEPEAPAAEQWPMAFRAAATEPGPEPELEPEEWLSDTPRLAQSPELERDPLQTASLGFVPLPNPPTPGPAPAEWPGAAQPTDYAQHQVGPTPPQDLFTVAAVSALIPDLEHSPESEHPDADAWLADTGAWPSDPPASDVVHADEVHPGATGPFDSSQAEETDPPDREDSTALELTVPPSVAAGTPLVVRIELAIVDGQLGIVNSANNSAGAARNDHEDEVDPESPPAAAPLASLAPELPAPWSQPVGQPDIPPATIAAPWSAPATASTSAPAPVQATPWSQNPPLEDPLAAIPAQALVPQPTFQPQPVPRPAPQPVQPLYEAQPLPPASVLAPPVQQQPLEGIAPAAAQNQNDLWFVSTQPEDVDSALDDKNVVAPKGSSSILTVALTIGMAILVIVLVLVFFSLMTSLLG